MQWERQWETGPTKSRSVIRFLWAIDISPVEIQRQLLRVYA